MEHRAVLRVDTDDMVASASSPLADPTNGQVIALRGSTSEDNLPWRGPNCLGDGLSRCVDGIFRFPPEDVACTAGVPVLLVEKRQHGLNNARIDTRCRLVIHVDGSIYHVSQLW